MKIREQHELVMEPGFVSGFDAYCANHFDPDYEDGWSGIEGVYNATQQEVDDWFHDHVIEHGGAN